VKTVRPTPKTIGSGERDKSTGARDSAHLPPIPHGLGLDCRRAGQSLPPGNAEPDGADFDHADPQIQTSHPCLNFRVQEIAAIGRVLA